MKMANKKPESNAEAEFEQSKTESKFSKEQLLAAERFRGKRDLLNALLSPGESYTVKDAEQKISSYMKGKVK